MKIMSYSYKLLLCALLLLTANSLKAIEGFSLIPAGAFTMGDSLDGDSNAPTRTVTLDAYFIGKYEVTKAEWDEVRTWGLSNGYTDLAAGSGKAGDHPVQTISWYDMLKWCNARSQKEGLMPVYHTNDAQATIYKTGDVNVTNAQVNWTANGYRLPTEAEWEKAARGGLSGKRFPWGDTISHSQANYNSYSTLSYDLSRSVGNFHPNYATGSEPYTSLVGAFAANGYGLYDMSGNVFEACWDWWGTTYYAGSQSNPRGSSSGSYRVFRGGSWNGDGAFGCRVAGRGGFSPTISENSFGFRVALSAVDKDSDSDGLMDAAETNTGVFVSASNTGTNPNNADTDADGVPDGLEVKEKTSPVDATKFNSFSQGLVAYYPFSENAKDFSGAGNDSALSNADLTTDRFGISSSAMRISAPNGGAESANDIPIIGNEDRTIAFWCKFSSQGGADSYTQVYTEWGDSSGAGTMFSLSEQSTSDGFVWFWGAYADINHVLADPPSYDQWRQVTFVYQSSLSEARCYLDGVLQPPTGGNYLNQTNTLRTVATTLRMRGQAGDYLDDVRIYNRALASSEVQALYSSESPRRFQIIEGSFTWHEAKADAEARGGRLAVLDTQEKIDEANAFLQSKGLWPFMWIGLSDDQNEGQWKWIGGQALAVSNWQPNQPSGSGPNGGDEHYGQILPFPGEDSGMWNDLPNEGGYNSPIGYLLELSEVSLEFVASSNGSITGAGNYALGSTATLTATPDVGFIFSGWTGDATGMVNPLSLTMDANKTIGATFDPDYSDRDGDGLTNYEEHIVYYTNANSSDSDEDGYSDGEEVERGSNPNYGDSYPQVYLSFSTNGDGYIDAICADSYDWYWGDYYIGGIALRSTVTLTAVPDSGYVFSAWSGDDLSNTNPLELQMDANKSVQASFVPDYADSDDDGLTNYAEVVTHYTNPKSSDSDGDGYTDGEEVERGSGPNDSNWYPLVYLNLSFSINGVCHIQAKGISSDELWIGESYNGYVPLRSTVTLTAVPNSGFIFSGWIGDASRAENPLSLTMDGNKSVQVDIEFDTADNDGDGLTNYDEALTYFTDLNSTDSDQDGYSDGEEVERGSDPNNSGSKPQVYLSFSSNGGGRINATGIGSYNSWWGWHEDYYQDPYKGYVNLHSTVMLTAVPDSGYLFSGWAGDATESSSPLSLTMDVNKSVQATFEPDNADNDGDGLSNYDEAVTHSTDPNSSDSDGDGYSDNEEIERGSDPNYSWSKPQVYLSFSSNGGGRINSTGIGSYNYWWGWNEYYYQDPYDGYVDLRSTVTLTATPYSGYLFSSWSGDGTGASNSLSLMMDVDKSVQASFEPDYADSDADGLSNYVEAVTHHTDPNSFDTDGDGFSDGEEIERGSNPNYYWSKPLGSISGVVTDKSAVGLAGITVVAYKYNNYDDYYNYGSWHATSSTTGENGSYQLHGLNAGRYRIEFRDYSGKYLSAWSSFITISESEEAEDINASLVKPSSISGTITDDKGASLEGIEVSVYSINSDADEPGAQWDWMSYATTDTDGAYTVSGLPAGTYRLAFSGGWSGNFLTEYYNNALSIDDAQDIVLSEADDREGIDASLKTASRINGVVTDQDGSPLEEISVSVYQYDAKYEWWHWVAQAETDEFGEYSLGGLAAGNYRVAFRDYVGEYAFECYDNSPNIESAKDIVVAESADVSGINASMVKASGIAGVITGPDGQTPLANVEVELERWTGDDWSWQDQTLTDVDGSYRFDGLPAGTYRIEFEDKSGQYALEYYNNEVEFDFAEDIVLAAEQQLEDINASLVLGSRINGKVTGPDGNPLVAVYVDIFRLQENGQWDWYDYTEANSDGTYEIGGLPNGTYRVGFLDDDEVHAVQFYKNNGNTMYFELARSFVISSPETISGVNGKFDKKAGTIKGKVTGSDGSTPLHEVRIEAYRKDDQGAWRLVLFEDFDLDDDGSFDPSMLPAGTYRFKFQKEGYLTKFYGDVYSIDQAKNIFLTEGQVVEGINVSLSTEPAPQSISAFENIGNKTFGDAPFTLTVPTASSGLPVTLSVKSGSATISGNTVTITGAGFVVLAANQAGDANYAAAPEVTMNFTVSKAAQKIAAFDRIGDKTYGDAPFVVTAPSSDSSLPVTLSVKSGPAKILGNTMTITGAGTVVLAAKQAGDANYDEATEVTTSFTVAKATQTIGAITGLENKTLGDESFTVAVPSATSGLPVTLSVKSGPATISGNTVTINKTIDNTGIVTLAANQSGNANYLAADEVVAAFAVMDIKSMAGDFVGNYDFDGAAELQDAYDYNGQLSLKVTKGGAFSGSLVVRGSRVGIRGQFDENGFTELDIKTKTLSGISLELLFEPMSDKEYQVAANMVWADQPSTPFNCYPVAYAGTGADRNLPLGGKQINSLMASQSTSGIDFGHGFVMIKTSNDGTLKFTGRAADGSAITGTTRLVKDAFGDILAPVSFPLSAVKGLLHGVAEIYSNPEEGQYHLSSPSEWTWVRLPQVKAKTYKEGFAEKLGVYGQVWSFTKSQSALPEAKDGFTFQVDPDSVLLEEPLELNGTWPSSNKPTWIGAPKGFTFKVNTATGQINGAVPRTINGKAAKALSYQGLLVRPALDSYDGAPLMGGGYLLGTESSGVVEFTTP